MKLNGGQVLTAGRHTVTLFGDGYFGFSYLAGLSPIYGFNSADAAGGWTQYPDTIDPRQKDQTHTALMAVNDVFQISPDQQFQFSGFFRTYNLSLYSDFGDGLIRQSEFRTVVAPARRTPAWVSRFLTLLAGIDYQREAPRRDDLDHYNVFNSADPSYYGPFVEVDGSNITIAPLSPYLAGEGRFARYFHYYLGLAARRDFHRQPGSGRVGPVLEHAGRRELSQGHPDIRPASFMVGARGGRQLRQELLHRRSPHRPPPNRLPPPPAVTRWKLPGPFSW